MPGKFVLNTDSRAKTAQQRPAEQGIEGDDLVKGDDQPEWDSKRELR